MRRQRNTKIIATLGPSSSERAMIEALFESGVDVFRLNFSHGSHDEHAQRIAIIRQLEADAGRPIGVLADLQGPKLRIGEMTADTELEPGAAFRLDMKKAKGDRVRAPLPHREIFRAINVGDDLLIDDGRIRLRVSAMGSNYADTEVIAGGPLKSRKGVNVPEALLPLKAMTDKDRADLRFALEHGADWIALSFVQRAEDIAEARRIVAGRAAIMAKIEKPAALLDIEAIIELSDAVMVARGDLGVELPAEDVPGLQKRLIRNCRREGKPVVVATQMLESMVSAPVPTRAEVSDVATAIYDGADAIMLSAETASGAYPKEAVALMNRVTRRVEEDSIYRSVRLAERTELEATPADAITFAARQVAETLSAAAIVTYTTSGSTALRASRERPLMPIVVLTPNVQTSRRLTLAWGLHCFISEDAHGFTDMVNRATGVVRQSGYGEAGDRIVITAGVPFGTPGATNTLRIAWLT